MACNCMAEFENTIVEKQPFKELKITKAQFDQALIFGTGNISNRPVLEIELTCEGRKKPVRRSVVYNYCPFCGKSFEAKTKGTEEAPAA